ncbi:DotU family type IV/VI secretion system protein [Betaproteobacteria bacterium]|nr:DotU family type IV/VI secretion system protein [Betaproteobacteria bacterium]
MKDPNDTYSEPKMTSPFTIHESVKSLREDTSQSSFAITQLREFVKQIFSIISEIELSIHNNHINKKNIALKSDASPVEENPQMLLALQVRDRVCRILELKQIDFLKIASPSEKERYEEVKYIYAALADEIFLSEPWSGQKEFINYLIEEKIFLTSEAGEKIFDRIDEVLNSKPEQMIELAKLYLQILIIGFEGQYRGRDSENKLEEYIRSLYVYINRKEPGLDNKKSEVNGEQKIDSVHYERILSNLQPVKFFRVNKPVFISLVIIALLLIISQITYVVMTKPLRDILNSQKTVLIKKSKHQQLASLISVKNTKRKLKEL